MSRKHPGSLHHKALDRLQWQVAKHATHTRDNWLCCRCGKRGRLEAHHVIGLGEGGDPYSLDNLESLCRTCHIEIHKIRRETPAETAWRNFTNEMG